MGEDWRKQRELTDRLRTAVVNYDEVMVVRTAEDVARGGFSAYDACLEGLAAGLEDAARMYDEWEYFLPELFNCAQAARLGLDILLPLVHDEDRAAIGSGVVFLAPSENQAEVLANRIVHLAFSAVGFDIRGLDELEEGCDVGKARVAVFPQEWGIARENLKKAVAYCLDSSPEMSVIIGGGPPTRDVAHLVGDKPDTPVGRYSPVREAIRLVASLRIMAGVR